MKNIEKEGKLHSWTPQCCELKSHCSQSYPGEEEPITQIRCALKSQVLPEHQVQVEEHWGGSVSL